MEGFIYLALLFFWLPTGFLAAALAVPPRMQVEISWAQSLRLLILSVRMAKGAI